MKISSGTDLILANNKKVQIKGENRLNDAPEKILLIDDLIKKIREYYVINI